MLSLVLKKKSYPSFISIFRRTNCLDITFFISVTWSCSSHDIHSLFNLVAHFVQTMIESFELHFRSLTSSSSSTIDDDDPPGSKEAKNLITLVAELYNFQVVSCVLVYDLVRMLIEKLDEPSVELLLRVMRGTFELFLGWRFYRTLTR